MQDDLRTFLAEWHDPSPFPEIQASGSTGMPRRMRMRKGWILNSARFTYDYLGLRKGGKALLCMSLRYIAEKTTVIRSLYAGLDLEVCESSRHPLADWGDTPLRSAVMTPLQVYNALRVPEECEQLEQTNILIIGGGAIDTTLKQEIRRMPNTVYSTHGMTETLSRVTLRRLNGLEASPYHHLFSSVTLSLLPGNTLMIDTLLVCDERLVTSDVARLLPSGSFVIIGRRDNIINSGGIKIQIEEVEKRLWPCMMDDFVITSASNEKLGEAVALLTKITNAIESPLPTQPEVCYQSDRKPAIERTDSLLPGGLTGCSPKYQHPRFVLKVKVIPEAGGGKTDRAACRELARNIVTKIL